MNPMACNHVCDVESPLQDICEVPENQTETWDFPYLPVVSVLPNHGYPFILPDTIYGDRTRYFMNDIEMKYYSQTSASYLKANYIPAQCYLGMSVSYSI